jgi:hypothetical protein
MNHSVYYDNLLQDIIDDYIITREEISSGYLIFFFAFCTVMNYITVLKIVQ